MRFPNQVVRGENGVGVVTALRPDSDTPIYMADSRHPRWQDILNGLEAGDPAVWDLFDVGVGMVNKLRSITERVSWDGSNVLWDGDPVHSVIAKQIARALETGEQNYEALAKFWEKLEGNPDAHSKEQAYSWLATHDFKITADGDLVAYKGVHKTDDGYRSSSSGTAFVNGFKRTGQIPQALGDEVTMPRSSVTHDPGLGCHTGLHVGDWTYASNFATATVEVHVNPRDIVSVPTDCGARKMRVCRYRLVREVTEEYQGTPVLTGAAPAWQGDVGYRV